MAGDPNMSDWAPGQQPPWLAAYGPPPVDSSLAGAPGAPMPAPDQAPPAPTQADAAPPPGMPPPVDSALAGAPGQEQSAFAPPWLQSAVPDPNAPTPNALLVPDAISGGAPLTPQQQDQANATALAAARGPVSVMGGDPGLAALHAQNAGYNEFMSGGGTTAQRDHDLTAMTDDQRAAAVSNMSPDQFVKYKSDQASELIAKEAAGRAQIEADNAKRAQAALDAQTNATNTALAETKDMVTRATALANTKVDPNRYVHNRGIAGTVGDFIGVTLGGAMSQYSGGKNLALDQLNKKIDNDIAAQKDDIANGWKGIEVRKGAIASELAAHGDLYKAQETYRVAAQQSAISSLQTQLQQYNPAGSTAIRGRDALDQLHALQAQTVQKYTQQTFDNNLKVETQKAKAREDAEALAQHLRENKIAQQNANTSSYQASTAAKAQKATQIHEQNADMIALAGKDQAQRERVNDQGIGVSTPVLDPKTGSIAVDKNTGLPQVTTKPLMMADGKTPYVAPKASAEKIQGMFVGAEGVARLVDKIQRDIAEHGGQADFSKSPVWQRDKGNMEDLIFQLHESKGIEGFRPGTAEMLEKLAGGVDPTSFVRDGSPGLKNLRENIITDLNATLRHKGNYDGPSIEFPDLSKAGGSTSPADAEFAKSIGPAKTPSGLSTDSIMSGMPVDDIRGKPIAGPGSPLATDDDAISLHLGYTGTQAKLVDDAAMSAQSGDPAAAAAGRTRLETIAKDAATSGLRNRAKSALQRLDELDKIGATTAGPGDDRPVTTPGGD